MEKELIEILISLGLTDKEAKVYLAATEVGTQPVSSIGQAAKINRVTTYDILEKLKQKGLVSYFTKKKIKYFTATNPETLLEEFEKRTNNLRTSIPKFKRLTGEIVHSEDQKYFREIRLVPSDQFNFTNEIHIYDDKVAIISFKDELIGMILESIEIANSQRAIFNMCWQFAEVIENLENIQAKTKLLKPISHKEIAATKEPEKIPTEPPNLSLF